MEGPKGQKGEIVSWNTPIGKIRIKSLFSLTFDSFSLPLLKWKGDIGEPGGYVSMDPDISERTSETIVFGSFGRKGKFKIDVIYKTLS